MLNDDNNDLRLKDTDKMKKEIKSKRCLLDQNKKFFTDLVKLLEEDDESDAKKNMKVCNFEFW